jgi:hypothetical protein
VRIRREEKEKERTVDQTFDTLRRRLKLAWNNTLGG